MDDKIPTTVRSLDLAKRHAAKPTPHDTWQREAEEMWARWFEGARNGGKWQGAAPSPGMAEALMEQLAVHPCVACKQEIAQGEPRTRAPDGGWRHKYCPRRPGDHDTAPSQGTEQRLTPADGMPSMITRQQKADLAALGFSPAQIFNMTPGQAQAHLRAPVTVELTLLANGLGSITKRIFLDANGKRDSSNDACILWCGAAGRVTVTGAAELANLIGKLPLEQAITLGALRDGLEPMVEVTTRERLKASGRVVGPKLITRTHDNIVYRGGPVWMLIDYDTKGMPPEVAASIAGLGGFWKALLMVLPELSLAARVERRSTSAGLYRTDTGETIPGSDGMHEYVLIKDGNDAERFLKTLHARCWLHGLGWIWVSAGSALLERSIVDRTVWQASRIVFEGGPELVPPLAQDKESRRPIAYEEAVLDTVATCRSLTLAEQAVLQALVTNAKQQIAPEAVKVRKVVTAERVKRLVARGKSEPAARKMVERWHEGVLHPDIVLPFDDEEFAGCTVGDVLADPERFAGETLADPNEGVSYGRCKAKIMLHPDGTPWIHSFAHGRTIYDLRYDAEALSKLIKEIEKTEAVRLLAARLATADVDAIELDALKNEAHAISGVGKSVINATIKTALAQHAAAKAKQQQAWRASQRQDPRPQIPAPGEGAPWLPQMRAIEDVLGVVEADVPPARDLDGDMTQIQLVEFPDLHVFTSANAKGDDENDQTTPT